MQEVAAAYHPDEPPPAPGSLDDRHAPDMVSGHLPYDCVEVVCGFHRHVACIHDVADTKCRGPCGRGGHVGTSTAEEAQEAQLRHDAEEVPSGIDDGESIEVLLFEEAEQGCGIILPMDGHRVAGHHVLDSRSVRMWVRHAEPPSTS
jgi:hypothetical protein